MSAVDTIGSVCIKDELKNDKEHSCACKVCSEKEKK